MRVYPTHKRYRYKTKKFGYPREKRKKIKGGKIKGPKAVMGGKTYYNIVDRYGRRKGWVKLKRLSPKLKLKRRQII